MTAEDISRALIVKWNMHGLVLWHEGDDIEAMVTEYLPYIEELGLDDAPDGISIWEGVYKTAAHDETDMEAEPVGKYRNLTEEELSQLLEGKSPFIDEE